MKSLMRFNDTGRTIGARVMRGVAWPIAMLAFVKQLGYGRVSGVAWRGAVVLAAIELNKLQPAVDVLLECAVDDNAREEIANKLVEIAAFVGGWQNERNV